MTVVMSLAHVGTVKGAVQAARDYGIQVMADVMLEEDKVMAAKRMEGLGVDYIIVHLGYDERHEEPWRLERNVLLRDSEAVAQAVSIPVQAVGGLSLEQAVAMPQRGAPLVVIGAPLAIADKEFKPGADDAALETLLRDLVRRVKGSLPPQAISLPAEQS
jgi:3-hexulose-6-phosphate synthase/6-phospho-3-hexuloisomerase